MPPRTAPGDAPRVGGGGGAPIEKSDQRQRDELRIRLLGGFGVECGARDVPPSSWHLRRARDVVKLLALARDHRMHREQLMETLWPEREPESAANNLHQALHVARRALSGVGADGALPLRDGVVDLYPEQRLWVDVEAFESAVRDARASDDLDAFRSARALYRGELLPDDRYEEWTIGRREALEQDHLALSWEVARRATEARQHDEAIETLRELIAADPAHEAAHRELMRLLAVGGHRRLAVRQFEIVKATLRRTLEVDPSDETIAVYEDILRGELKNEGEEVFTAAPVVSVPASDRRSTQHNLPIALSSFVGREREIDDVGRLLGEARLVTLSGPGGCGKTRLAVESAWAVRDRFADGVWLVQLAPLRHGALVIQEIADVFEIREQSGRPLLDSLIAHLRERELLVVLDNCEHLIDASAAAARAILSASAGVRFLTTSREPLRIGGEVVFRVPSLAIPDPSAGDGPDDLSGYASVRLFVDRAAAISPRFRLSTETAPRVAELCYRLDGLPLAIELAASRTAALSVETIAERLEDRFRLLVGGDRTAIGRQQTLRATLDWSYQLLDERERSVLRRLAVFVGGIPLDAAEDVCASDGVEPADVAGVIGALVDKSLVVAADQDAGARFRLLETVREYGLERLDEAGGRADAEARHAAWFVELAGRLRDELPFPERGAALLRLELEHDNLRVAFDRRLDADPPVALRIAVRLWPFWLWRAYLAEGRRRIDRAMRAAPGPSADRAEAMLGQACLTIRSGDSRRGAAIARASADEALGLGQTPIACRALQVTAVAVWSRDDLADAKDIFGESLAIATEIGDEAARAAAMESLAIVSWYAGDGAEASRLFAESLDAFRRIEQDGRLAPPMLDIGEAVVPQPATGGYRIVIQESFGPFHDVPTATAIGYVLANEGMVARLEGDLARARARIEESLEHFEKIGDDRAIGQAIVRLGNLAVAEGDLDRAHELLMQGFEIRRRIGDWRGMMLTQLGLANLAMREGDFAQARRLLDDAVATFQQRGDLWGQISALRDLANVALATGDLARAKELLHRHLELSDLPHRPRWIAWARVQLGEIARLEGDEPAAESTIREALEIFERVGDERGAAHCRALLAAD